MADYEDTSLEQWFEKESLLSNYLTYEESKILYDEFGYEPISLCMGIFQVKNSNDDVITKYYPIWDITHLEDGMYPALELHKAFEFFREKFNLLLTYRPLGFGKFYSTVDDGDAVIPVIYYLDDEGHYMHYEEHPRISIATANEIYEELKTQATSGEGTIDEYMHNAVKLAIKFLQLTKTKKFV